MRKIFATASLGLFGVDLTETPAQHLVRTRPRPVHKRKKHNWGRPQEPNGRAEKQYRLKGIRP